MSFNLCHSFDGNMDGLNGRRILINIINDENQLATYSVLLTFFNNAYWLHHFSFTD